MSRSAVVNDRLSRRGYYGPAAAPVAPAPAEDETASNLVFLLGIGFGAWVLFGFVMPAMLGAATQTKRSYKEFKHAGSEYGSGSRYEPPSRPHSSRVIDAEFIEHPARTTSSLQRSPHSALSRT